MKCRMPCFVSFGKAPRVTRWNGAEMTQLGRIRGTQRDGQLLDQVCAGEELEKEERREKLQEKCPRCTL